MDENAKKKILGKLIRKEREKQKLSQEELGFMINMDPRSLRQIEKGENFPTLSNFCAIVEALKTEPNYFLGSIIQFNKKEENPIDFELRGNISTLGDEAKKNLNEFIKNSRK